MIHAAEKPAKPEQKARVLAGTAPRGVGCRAPSGRNRKLSWRFFTVIEELVERYLLVRIELFRAGRTCQLLITRHQPGKSEKGHRPLIENSLLFRGVNGFTESKLSCSTNDLGALQVPRFWSRSGEELPIPSMFGEGVAAAAHGANCIGCSHAHFLTAPAELALGAGPA